MKRCTGPQGEEGAFYILENIRFRLKNETKKRPQTNISVDVAKKMRKTPEILKIQAEQGGRTNISVDVAKKSEKHRKY